MATWSNWRELGPNLLAQRKDNLSIREAINATPGNDVIFNAILSNVPFCNAAGVYNGAPPVNAESETEPQFDPISYWLESGNRFWVSTIGNYVKVKALGPNGRQLGITSIIYVDIDKQFGYAISALMLATGAEWTEFAQGMSVVNAGAKAESGDYSGLANVVATSYAGASDNISGGSEMSFSFEFDAVDIDAVNIDADFVGDSNFTLGESTTQFSDAETVDFGFNVEPGIGDDFSTTAAESGADSAQQVTLNGTPESGVSDYGAVDYGFSPVLDNAKTLIGKSAISAALKKSAPSKSIKSATNANSLDKFSQGLNSFGNAIAALGSAQNQVRSIGAQKHPVNATVGQLQARPKGKGQNSSGANGLAVIAALVGGLVFFG